LSVGTAKKWDVFISHASEDKASVAEPLAQKLKSMGIQVWYDNFTLRWGSSLLKSINEGLRNSKYGVVIFSKNFFTKNWPQRELDGLFSMMVSTDKDLILPVRHNITQEELVDLAPIIAGLLNRSTEEGVDALAQGVSEIVSQDIGKESTRYIKRKGVLAELSDPSLEHIGLLAESIHHYVKTSFDRENTIQLSQAGAGGDTRIHLKEIFIDLEVRLHHHDEGQSLEMLQDPKLSELKDSFLSRKKVSAAETFLGFDLPRAILIGGPGQGKSTLGQFICQVHRKHILGYSSASSDNFAGYSPTLARIPFFIILKDFAQWLINLKGAPAFEKYLSFMIEERTGRKLKIEDILQLLKNDPILLILDGIDEVSEPKLLEQVVDLVKEFIGMCEQVLKSNIQIIATSRPTSYHNEFKEFLHLSLAPLSENKISEYADKWIVSRDLEYAEATTLRESLKDGLKDPAASLLMSTPLQITIFLLIVQSGKNPPRQREELFHEYLEIIYKRETSKSKTIIKTEKRLLLGLHQYIGYTLHKRASESADIGAKMQEEEFEEEVLKYLRHNDPYAAIEVLKEKAVQMINESRQRLVLLVELQKGYYGFELRSFQEFFAAAYLVDTAFENNSQQRFRRFYSIAASPHWKNVALFFAGRIGRVHGGSAAHILEICREIDRDKGGQVLHFGKWLALDLAVDRSFGYSFNEVLQRGAIDYALELLDVQIAAEKEEEFLSRLEHLPKDDVDKHLRPIIEKRHNRITVDNISLILDIYHRVIGDTSKIEAIMNSFIEDKKLKPYLAVAWALAYTSPEFLRTKIQPLIDSLTEPELLTLFTFRFARQWERLATIWNVLTLKKTLARKVFNEALERTPRIPPRDSIPVKKEDFKDIDKCDLLLQLQFAWKVFETLSSYRRKVDFREQLEKDRDLLSMIETAISKDAVAIEVKAALFALLSSLIEGENMSKNGSVTSYYEPLIESFQRCTRMLSSLSVKDQDTLSKLLCYVKVPEPEMLSPSSLDTIRNSNDRNKLLIYLHIFDSLEPERSRKLALNEIPLTSFNDDQVRYLQRHVRRAGIFPIGGIKQNFKLNGVLLAKALEVVSDILTTQPLQEWRSYMILRKLLVYEWSHIRTRERKNMAISLDKIIESLDKGEFILTKIELTRLLPRIANLQSFDPQMKSCLTLLSTMPETILTKIRPIDEISTMRLERLLDESIKLGGDTLTGLLKWFNIYYSRRRKVYKAEFKIPALRFNKRLLASQSKHFEGNAIDGLLLLMSTHKSLSLSDLGNMIDIYGKRESISYRAWEGIVSKSIQKKNKETRNFLEAAIRHKPKYTDILISILLEPYEKMLPASDKIDSLKDELGLPFQPIKIV
jgi:hypothetical protein